MRALIVTAEFPPTAGGIGKHTFEMAAHWSKAADVTVLTFGLPNRARTSERSFRLVECRWSMHRTLRLIRLTRAVRKLLKQRFDVIYVGNWRAPGMAVRLATVGLLAAPRIVLAVHGSEVQYLQAGERPAILHRALFRWVTRPVVRFVALGTYQLGLIEALGVPRQRVHVSPEGVDPTPYLNVDTRRVAELAARLGVHNRPVLLTVGRLVERKGHDIVLQALVKLLASMPDVAYVVVGSGPNEIPLRQLATKLGISPKSALFCGIVDAAELPTFYQLCDVFVMPNRQVGSDIEGFGIVFLEAAAAGKPAIGGRSGGTSDAVLDGVTGFLVDPRSVNAVADAVLTLLENPVLAADLGDAGRRRVLASFQYADVARNIFDFALVPA
jgi:phosphatidyl-myo-inositol dimannoside synthase